MNEAQDCSEYFKEFTESFDKIDNLNKFIIKKIKEIEEIENIITNESIFKIYTSYRNSYLINFKLLKIHKNHGEKMCNIWIEGSCLQIEYQNGEKKYLSVEDPNQETIAELEQFLTDFYNKIKKGAENE